MLFYLNISPCNGLSLWVLDTKSEFVYNSNGNKTQNIVYTLEDTSWNYSEKHLYTYDGQSRIEQEIVYWWDTDDSLWTGGTDGDEYDYDSDGNLILYSQHYGNIFNSFKNVYEYDSVGNKTLWLEYGSKNYYWNSESDWELSSKTYYYYTVKNQQTVLACDDVQNTIAIYSHGSTLIVNTPDDSFIGTITVYDVLGHKIITRKSSGKQTIIDDLHLDRNVYIVQVISGKTITTKCITF